MLTMIDLAGHEKYFKTTVFGLVSHSPVCCVLAITAGTTALTPPHHMTLEHLGIAYVLNVPIIIALTKSDQASPEDIDRTISFVSLVLRSFKREAVVITSERDVTSLLTATHTAPHHDDDCTSMSSSDRKEPGAIPVFVTSSVSGIGIDELRRYLFHLPVSPVDSCGPVAGPMASLSAPMDTADTSMSGGQGCSSVLSEIRVLAAYGLDGPEGEGGPCGEASCKEGARGARGDEVIVEGSVSGGRGVRVGDEVR